MQFSKSLSFLFLILLLISGSAIAQCEGDIDRDNDTDGTDLRGIVLDYGRTDCSISTPCLADLNEDNTVNDIDLIIFIDAFGIDCFRKPKMVPVWNLLLF